MSADAKQTTAGHLTFEQWWERLERPHAETYPSAYSERPYAMMKMAARDAWDAQTAQNRALAEALALRSQEAHDADLHDFDWETCEAPLCLRDRAPLSGQPVDTEAERLQEAYPRTEEK